MLILTVWDLHAAGLTLRAESETSSVSEVAGRDPFDLRLVDSGFNSFLTAKLYCL